MSEVRLEAERLILRMFREDDFEAYARIFGDPDVARYLSGRPLERWEAWRHMAFVLGHWALGREDWGKGYATESARPALAYAFTEIGCVHVISLIQPANVASIKVAERLGERLEGKTELFGKEVLVYGIDRETWRG